METAIQAKLWNYIVKSAQILDWLDYHISFTTFSRPFVILPAFRPHSLVPCQSINSIHCELLTVIMALTKQIQITFNFIRSHSEVLKNRRPRSETMYKHTVNRAMWRPRPIPVITCREVLVFYFQRNYNSNAYLS